MLRLSLIRHGMTEGNKQSRYVGVTDEPLSPDGREELLKKELHIFPGRIFVSPRIRCRETAEIFFKNTDFTVIDELSECDFGDFENKNYLELSDNPDYQAWIDSGGTLPFPNGESREEVVSRNQKGLKRLIKICKEEGITEAAAIVHGGTIMNLLSEYGSPKKSFYDWHVENGCGYLVEVQEKEKDMVLRVITKL